MRSYPVHRLIKDYYIWVANPQMRFPNLDDLNPLIESVYHLCQAKDYDEAFQIYFQKIDQEKAY